jgi:hypothetical protein
MCISIMVLDDDASLGRPESLRSVGGSGSKRVWRVLGYAGAWSNYVVSMIVSMFVFDMYQMYATIEVLVGKVLLVSQW